MDGFSSSAILVIILNTGRLYRCMQHSSLPTLCGSNTRVCSSLPYFFSSYFFSCVNSRPSWFYKMCMQLGTSVPEACCSFSSGKERVALSCPAFISFFPPSLYQEDLWTLFFCVKIPPAFLLPCLDEERGVCL